MARRRIVHVTRTDFWYGGAGSRARTADLLRLLAAGHDLTVVVLRPITPNDARALARFGLPARVVGLDDGQPLAEPDYAARLATLCTRDRIEICIVDRIELSFLLDARVPGTRYLLDTHDLSSDRGASMKRFGANQREPISWQEELAILSRYDVVLLIQRYDFDKTRAALGDARCLLVPHPAVFERRALRPVVANIGLVASRWHANVDGLDWFARTVWPTLRRPGLTLSLYGYIGGAWRSTPGDGVAVRGYVADLGAAYGEIDIVVNPVRYGAGLKIKTVEALANGLPLVTTSEGARGLMDHAHEAFVVADDPQAFASAITLLVGDLTARERLAAAAFALAQDRFSREACYGALDAWLRT